MKKIKQNENGLKRIRRENTKRYKTNDVVNLHTNATSPDVTARISTVIEKKVNWLSD